MRKIIFTILALSFINVKAADPSFKIALLKYNGGGDWYANLETSLPNLITFCNSNLGTNINPEQGIVEVGSPEIFDYPFLHMTGHGNWVLSNAEAENLRKYLVSGGFLHIDDNCFYSFESDLGDGWEDFEVHKDKPEVHQKALKMGANLIQYVFNQQGK